MPHFSLGFSSAKDFAIYFVWIIFVFFSSFMIIIFLFFFWVLSHAGQLSERIAGKIKKAKVAQNGKKKKNEETTESETKKKNFLLLKI